MNEIIYPGSHQMASAEAQELTALASKIMPKQDPLVRADDVAYILFEKPDLHLMKTFLLDFGFEEAEQTEEALYMRGAGPLPFIYAAYKGKKSRYLGAGFSVKTRDALETLCQSVDGAKIEKIEGPGGGERVRLYDPDGHIVDVVYGREERHESNVRREAYEMNTPWKKTRVNEGLRPPLEPASVVRLGHVVLSTAEVSHLAKWYMRHLGFIPTDVQCTRDGSPLLAFMRLDRGESPADHHALAIGAMPGPPRYLHSAYETIDLDDVAQGQQFLRQKGWKHNWGLGRHILGSQIFDYWSDPYGDEVEHYADGDVFDSSQKTHFSLMNMGTLWMWGNDIPPSMRPKPSLGMILRSVIGILMKKIDPKKLALVKEAMQDPPRPWIK